MTYPNERPYALDGTLDGTSHPGSTTSSLAGHVLGRYLLGRCLGEGGMGAVYEATHQDLGKRAAIKTLHENYADSPETRSRLLYEGRAASRIRHPNVVDARSDQYALGVILYECVTGREPPTRSPNRGPPYWASTVLRRTAFGDVA